MSDTELTSEKRNALDEFRERGSEFLADIVARLCDLFADRHKNVCTTFGETETGQSV
jgi:hypothetical protein